jgi:hypothetical protein
VFYVGFPKESRQKLSEHTWSWGSYHGNGIASAVTDHDVICRVDRDELVEGPTLLPMPRVGFRVGGMSGGPIFAMGSYWVSAASALRVPFGSTGVRAASVDGTWLE